MAQKVVLIDDLDGSEGEETLRYAVDGQEYEIDLSGKNAAKFRSDLKVYIEKSREVTPQPVITGIFKLFFFISLAKSKVIIHIILLF